MFNSWKIYLKKKIDAAVEETRIQAKLHKFFTSNPDVDHYLSDMERRKYNANFILGMFLGFLLMFLVSLMIVSYWISLGYLNIPGWR